MQPGTFQGNRRRNAMLLMLMLILLIMLLLLILRLMLMLSINKTVVMPPLILKISLLSGHWKSFL